MIRLLIINGSCLQESTKSFYVPGEEKLEGCGTSLLKAWNSEVQAGYRRSMKKALQSVRPKGF